MDDGRGRLDVVGGLELVVVLLGVRQVGEVHGGSDEGLVDWGG